MAAAGQGIDAFLRRARNTLVRVERRLLDDPEGTFEAEWQELRNLKQYIRVLRPGVEERRRPEFHLIAARVQVGLCNL